MYTDFLGQPFTEGDEIVYAQSAYGGGAVLKRAFVEKIVPLVEHRDRPGESVYMRADQGNKPYPTEFKNSAYADPDKRYVVQIMKPKYRYNPDPDAPNRVDQRYTIPQSQHIFKVPA